MRNIIIKVIVEDDDTELQTEASVTFNQVEVMNKFGVDIVHELLPQLHRELDYKLTENGTKGE
jgi:hypothetical protein